MVVEVLGGPFPDRKRIRLVPNGGDRKHAGDSESDDESSSDGMDDERHHRGLDKVVRAWQETIRHIGELQERASNVYEIYRRAIAVPSSLLGGPKQLVAKHVDDEPRPMGHLGDSAEQDCSQPLTQLSAEQE